MKTEVIDAVTMARNAKARTMITPPTARPTGSAGCDVAVADGRDGLEDVPERDPQVRVFVTVHEPHHDATDDHGRDDRDDDDEHRQPGGCRVVIEPPDRSAERLGDRSDRCQVLERPAPAAPSPPPATTIHRPHRGGR